MHSQATGESEQRLGNTSRFNIGMKRRLEQSGSLNHTQTHLTSHYSQEKTNCEGGEIFKNQMSLTMDPNARKTIMQSETSSVHTPNLANPLNDFQIDSLLNKVNLNNTFLSLATNDQVLIGMMKETIDYQRSVSRKREKLLMAITHNVRALAVLNQSNSAELKLTKERLEVITKWNDQLQEQNAELTTTVDVLKKDQQILAEKREEMAKMIIDSQANSAEISKLYDDQADMADQYEKLNVEITVLLTEKLTLKKELDRVDNDLRKMKKDFKEQRVNYDLLMDEVSKSNKQNSEYRGLILDNETKLMTISQEIQDLQKHLERKNVSLNRAGDEAMVYKKQIEKLMEELKDKSDSESFDDEKEKLDNIRKGLKSDQLEEQVKNLVNDQKVKQLEFESNIKRIESSLKFSRDANTNLKNDYDNLQDKFDKHMKASNNLYQDLKEDMLEQNSKLMKLQIFQDDSVEIMKKAEDENAKTLEEAKLELQQKIDELTEENVTVKQKITTLEAEMTQKMSGVKLLEIELEEKLKKLEKDGDGEEGTQE